MRPLAQLHHELLLADVMSTGHGPILGTRSLHWSDEAACAAFAQWLARQDAVRRSFIELHGPLGAGKTTFARHLLRELGVSGRIKSPTYALLEPYTVGELEISHLDFYRFTDAREWVDAGLRDVFAAPGLKLVEWPANAAGLLPSADLRLFIEPDADEQRHVLLQAGTPLGLQLLP